MIWSDRPPGEVELYPIIWYFSPAGLLSKEKVWLRCRLRVLDDLKLEWGECGFKRREDDFRIHLLKEHNMTRDEADEYMSRARFK